MVVFFENKKIQTKSSFFFLFFHSERLGFGKTLSKLHLDYTFLLTRVYDHAGCKQYCKDFTAALKMFSVFKKKRMYNSVFMRKENTSKAEIAFCQCF